MRSLVVSILTILAISRSCEASLTKSQHKFLQRAIGKWIKSQESLIPKLVQIGFHDCVGGCDGCVDVVNNHHNKGLTSTLKFCQRFRDVYAPQLSMADVIAFLGKETVKIAAKKAGGDVNITYAIGRPDCSSNRPLPTRPIPHGKDPHGIQFLKDSYNLSDSEAIALLGCHSLGQGHANGSGFSGRWDNHPLSLDNGYFMNMQGSGWEPVAVSNEHVRSTSWTRPRSSFLMLHSDMSAVISFNVSGPMDEPSCSFGSCPRSPTAQIVFDYADDQNLFHRELGKAYSKMISNGGQPLTLVSSL